MLFGLTVSFLATYVNYHVEYNKINQKIEKDSILESDKIKSKADSYISKIELTISSLLENTLFTYYLKDPDKQNRKNLEKLFSYILKSNSNYFQLRYIDKNGFENIKAERIRGTDDIFFVKSSKLQDKSNRYYFQETRSIDKNSFWHSKLDLNIENKKIEKPLRPTYRVATPVYSEEKFSGILIVNLEIDGLLNFIKQNNIFDVSLIDSDGFYILNNDTKKEWGRYLDKDKTRFTDFEDINIEDNNPNNFKSLAYIYSLSEYFANGEDLKLVLKIKDSYLKVLEEENMVFALTLAGIILFIAIPVGLLVSVPASRLQINFNKLFKENLRYLETINKYVVTMTVDTNKKMVAVSDALCKLSGYTKEELIGKEPSIFKSGKMDPKIYKELWERISKGMVWTGELENIKKNKEHYWIYSTVLPNYSKDKNIISYTSISKNVTDKKIIEKISKTDKLTGLYNRVMLDEVLENEIHRFKRYGSVFSLILIDIDHFKTVNDNFGHLVGDNVLIELSELLKTHVRDTDTVGRWGGEEFLVICSETDLEGATKLAEHMRKMVKEFQFHIVHHKTVSIGVSQVDHNDETISSLLKRADDNLYRAKDGGRDRVVSE